MDDKDRKIAWLEEKYAQNKQELDAILEEIARLPAQIPHARAKRCKLNLPGFSDATAYVMEDRGEQGLSVEVWHHPYSYLVSRDDIDLID